MNSLIIQSSEEQYKTMLADVKKPRTTIIQTPQKKETWYNEGFSITGSIVALISSIALVVLLNNVL